MATQVICRFNKYGYCRYKEMCRKQHINEKCENISCERKECMLRHPKICKFVREYGFCKFGEWCKFTHIEKENAIDEHTKENEIILKKLADIDKNLKELQQHEKEIIEKRIFDEKINKLETIIAEKDEEIQKFVLRVKEMEVTIDTLEKRFSDGTTKIEERLHAFEKKNEESNVDKIKTMEKRIYVLEKRRLGSDFCDYCDQEFKAGSEKERKEKETHIRDYHTFECNVCEFRNTNKEELNIHLLTCEIYVCSLCSYKHKRLSELKSHIKTKHTAKNAIIRHMKMDRENFTKLSSKNYFSEEI